MVPQMVRLLVGSDHRRVLPMAALVGGVFLVWVDLASRTALRPAELPVSIATTTTTTTTVGAPFFLWLMYRRNRPAGEAVLYLVGAVASARREDRTDTMAFLREADEAATRLGEDANHLWTAFGPANVAIHRVTAAMELGDVQVAVDLGPRINTAALPTERRVRHAIEIARAYVRWDRVDDALALLLRAEHDAPEQVRYHRLSRILVREMIQLPRPASRAVELAYRMGVHSTAPREP